MRCAIVFFFIFLLGRVFENRFPMERYLQSFHRFIHRRDLHRTLPHSFFFLNVRFVLVHWKSFLSIALIVVAVDERFHLLLVHCRYNDNHCALLPNLEMNSSFLFFLWTGNSRSKRTKQLFTFDPEYKFVKKKTNLWNRAFFFCRKIRPKIGRDTRAQRCRRMNDDPLVSWWKFLSFFFSTFSRFFLVKDKL